MEKTLLRTAHKVAQALLNGVGDGKEGKEGYTALSL